MPPYQQQPTTVDKSTIIKKSGLFKHFGIRKILYMIDIYIFEKNSTRFRNNL